eukprot:365608-Chlamydomonas_euryale.AAC.7
MRGLRAPCVAVARKEPGAQELVEEGHTPADARGGGHHRHVCVKRCHVDGDGTRARSASGSPTAACGSASSGQHAGQRAPLARGCRCPASTAPRCNSGTPWQGHQTPRRSGLVLRPGTAFAYKQQHYAAALGTAIPAQRLERRYLGSARGGATCAALGAAPRGQR